MRSLPFFAFALFFLVFLPDGLRLKAQNIVSDTLGAGAQPNHRFSYRVAQATGGTVYPVAGDYTFEHEVSRLEGAERDALYDRDTAALKQLWATDFSVGIFKANKVLPESASSPLPYYAVFIRVIESVRQVDGFVYVNGVDHTSLVDLNKTSVQPAPHKFTHVWKMFGSRWKMILKFPNDY